MPGIENGRCAKPARDGGRNPRCGRRAGGDPLPPRGPERLRRSANLPGVLRLPDALNHIPTRVLRDCRGAGGQLGKEDP